MTFLTLATGESCVLSESMPRGQDSIAWSKAQSSPLPRFNLKKRAISGDKEQLMLPTVNSAFLSGLFADVANARSAADGEGVATVEEDPRLDDSKPLKKSRVSLTRSKSRCGTSFMKLNEVESVANLSSLHAPTSCDTPFHDFSRQDSLHYQLHCVSCSSTEEGDNPDTATVLDIAQIAFPQLPPTVSSSSCNTLTRNASDLQSSLAENAQYESYGWFVEMDDDDVPTSTNSFSTNTSSLAFKAPTAPKASNYDDELEWAKAADTVDLVLGDFF